jgi:hypothetical protein
MMLQSPRSAPPAILWDLRRGRCSQCLQLRVVVRRRQVVVAAAAPADPQRWTRLNKPVVRQSQTVGYGQFLKDVRSQAVKEVVLSHEGTDRALLVYKDGRIAYCQFPADDARLADVLSTYGVVATQAVTEPSPPDTAQMRQFKDAAMYWVPAALIGVVYAVVTHMARTKGDFEVRLSAPLLFFLFWGSLASTAARGARSRGIRPPRTCWGLPRCLTVASALTQQTTGPHKAAQAG